MPEHDDANVDNGPDTETGSQEPPDDDGFPTQKETRERRVETEEAHDEGFPTERES